MPTEPNTPKSQDIDTPVSPSRTPRRAQPDLDEFLKEIDPQSIEAHLGSLGYPATSPTTGDGVHSWLFGVALRTKHFSEEEVIEFIQVAVRECGRDVPAREVLEALRNARRESKTVAEMMSFGRTQPKWPEADRKLIDQVLAATPDASPLFEASDTIPDTSALLSDIYGLDALVCVGVNRCRPFTEPVRKLVELNKFERLPYVVPSPMSRVQGRTQSGQISERSLDNTGPRCVLVIESDKKFLSKDDQAKIICHLRADLDRLFLIVDSGGDSLHAWFACRGVRESRLKRFMIKAVRHGADHMTWTKCQFVRMPGSIRENGRPQRILFFDRQTALRYV
jgi:hypothetical protein